MLVIRDRCGTMKNEHKLDQDRPKARIAVLEREEVEEVQVQSQAHLDGKLAGGSNSCARTESIGEKFHLSSYIEFLAGLCYGEGERSHKDTTDSTSTSLVCEDLDSDVVPGEHIMEAGARASAKRWTKVTNGKLYICAKCGVQDSPQWRRGPTGPNTLCNACGLQWVKNGLPKKKKDLKQLKFAT